MDTLRTTDSSPNRYRRTSAEIRRNQIIAAGAIGLASFGILKAVDSQHREEAYSDIVAARDQQEAYADAREAAIVALAMETPDPSDIITTFPVEQDENISTEAYAAYDTLLDSEKVLEYTENFEETILVSSNAHELNSTQPDEEFAIVRDKLGDEVVFVIKRLPDVNE